MSKRIAIPLAAASLLAACAAPQEANRPQSNLPPPEMAALPPSNVPPPAAVPSVPPPSEPMQLVRRGNVVGYQVVDSYGQPMGIVDSVAAVPPSGEVRYLIVSGPSFGPGNFIAVPASEGQAQGSRVIVTGSAQGWLQTRRYRGDQVAQVFGALGDVY
jgi:hypothetical protein